MNRDREPRGGRYPWGILMVGHGGQSSLEGVREQLPAGEYMCVEEKGGSTPVRVWVGRSPPQLPKGGRNLGH